MKGNLLLLAVSTLISFSSVSANDKLADLQRAKIIMCSGTVTVMKNNEGGSLIMAVTLNRLLKTIQLTSPEIPDVLNGNYVSSADGTSLNFSFIDDIDARGAVIKKSEIQMVSDDAVSFSYEFDKPGSKSRIYGSNMKCRVVRK